MVEGGVGGQAWGTRGRGNPGMREARGPSVRLLAEREVWTRRPREGSGEPWCQAAPGVKELSSERDQ